MAAGEVPKSIKASLFIDGEAVESSFANLRIITQGLRKDIDGLTVGTDAWVKKNAELQNLNKYLATIKAEAAGVGDAFSKVREEIENIAEGVAIGTVVSQAIRGAYESIKAFWEGSEKAYEEATLVQTALINKLQQTGGVAGETREQLEQYQKTLMAQTGVDDDVIAKGEDVLLSYTQVRGYIYAQAIPAITNLAAAQNNGKVTMESMASAAETLGKALDKPTEAKKLLKQVGIDLTNQQQVEIKTLNDQNKLQAAQQIILDEVAKRYGNLAQSIAQTDVGKLEAFDTAIGNMQEKLGGWISAGKAALASFFLPLIQSLGDARSEVDRLSDEFHDQQATVGDLEKNTEPLLDKYDQLTSKGKLNRTEQGQLKDIISKLSSTIPGAVTQWDKYGTALDINTGKAREFIKQQREMLKIQNADAISTTVDQINKLAGERYHIQGILNAGSVTEVGAGSGSAPTERNLTADEIKDYVTRVKAINVQMADLRAAVAGFEGDGPEPTKNKITPPQSGPTAEEQAAAARRAEARKKAQEEFLAASQALSEKVKEFNAEELADEMSKDDKEVQLVQLKYDRMIAEAKAFNTNAKSNKNANEAEIQKHQAEIDQLNINKQKAVFAVREQQQKDLSDSITGFLVKQTGTTGTELDKQTAEINAFFDNLQKKAGANDLASALQIAAARAIALNNAELDAEKKLLEEKKQLDDDYAVITDKSDNNELEKIKKKYDKERQALKDANQGKLQETIAYQEAMKALDRNEAAESAQEKKTAEKNLAIEAAQDISNAVFTIGENNRKAQLDAQIAQLEKEKEAELSNTNLTEDQKQAINNKYDEQEKAAKLAAWKADKDAALEQAIINGALAVVKALPNFYLAAAAGIAAAAQIVVIESQQPPQFASGGLTSQEPAGYVGQPTLFKNSASGRPFIAGEAGTEWIAPNWMVKSPRYANIIGMLEGARQDKRAYAAGGFNGTASAASSFGFDMGRIDRIEQALDTFIAEQRKVNAKPVVFSNKVYDDQKARNVQIVNNANAK